MITTERLLLRQWKDSDFPAFAKMSADPKVMEFFPKLLSREESFAMGVRIQNGIKENGFGWWAVEIPGVTSFAGFTGLSIPKFEASFTPCVEIGWRLASEYQGKGYATEGALACMKYAEEKLKLKEVFAFTVPANVNSRRVMEKIGLKHVGEFLHPVIEDNSPLKLHLLYQKNFGE